MMLTGNNYFVRVYKESKLLFFVVISFALVSIATNFVLRGELTPFYKWDLYANAIPYQDRYSFLEVRYNDNKLLYFPNTWREPEKLFFTNTLDLFIAIKKNTDKDPLDNYYKNTWLPKHPFFKGRFAGFEIFNSITEINQFPAWYKRYLSQHTNETVDSIKVFDKKVRYENNGMVKEISSELIYTIQ